MTQVYYDHSNGKRYFMGCNPDKERTPAKLFLSREQIEALPATYILNDQTPIENQGQEGSCTSFATNGANMVRTFIASGKYKVGSKQQFYRCETFYDGNPGQDVGSSLSTSAAVFAKYGFAPESAYPYSEPLSNPVPVNIMAMGTADEATKEIRLDGATPATTIANMKAALAPSAVALPDYPVRLGFTVYESFMDIGPDGNMPTPSGGVAGGHAVCCIGYDDTHANPSDGSTGAFLFRNSWDYTFGCRQNGTESNGSNGGCFWMPNTVIQNTSVNSVGDVWATVSINDFVTPTPTPTPTPNPATPTSCFLTCDTATPKVGQLVTFVAKVIANGKAIPVPVTIYHYLNGVKYVDKFAYSTLTFQTTFESAAPRPYYVSFAGNSTYGSSNSGLAVNVA
jgi:C1A family cysteine protease